MQASDNCSDPGDTINLLRDSLKRCSPETIDAAIRYRESKDTNLLNPVILGIIERFLEPDVRPRFKSAGDEQRLFEDLGIDSLTMVEIVIMVEETLQLSINNEELRDLRTVGDVKQFVDCKARGLPLPEKPVHMGIEDIDACMPHQPPFLFIQEAKLRKHEAQGTYKIAGNEFFLEGHFRDNPVFPASIMLEALGQLAVLYLVKTRRDEMISQVDPARIMFTSCDGVRCHHICRPGDTLTLAVKPKRIKHPLATFEGSISSGKQKVAFAEEITLTFDYCPATTDNASAPAVDQS